MGIFSRAAGLPDDPNSKMPDPRLLARQGPPDEEPRTPQREVVQGARIEGARTSEGTPRGSAEKTGLTPEEATQLITRRGGQDPNEAQERGAKLQAKGREQGRAGGAQVVEAHSKFAEELQSGKLSTREFLSRFVPGRAKSPSPEQWAKFTLGTTALVGGSVLLLGASLATAVGTAMAATPLGAIGGIASFMAIGFGLNQAYFRAVDPIFRWGMKKLRSQVDNESAAFLRRLTETSGEPGILIKDMLKTRNEYGKIFGGEKKFEFVDHQKLAAADGNYEAPGVVEKLTVLEAMERIDEMLDIREIHAGAFDGETEEGRSALQVHMEKKADRQAQAIRSAEEFTERIREAGHWTELEKNSSTSHLTPWDAADPDADVSDRLRTLMLGSIDIQLQGELYNGTASALTRNSIRQTIIGEVNQMSTATRGGDRDKEILPLQIQVAKRRWRGMHRFEQMLFRFNRETVYGNKNDHKFWKPFLATIGIPVAASTAFAATAKSVFTIQMAKESAPLAGFALLGGAGYLAWKLWQDKQKYYSDLAAEKQALNNRNIYHVMKGWGFITTNERDNARAQERARSEMASPEKYVLQQIRKKDFDAFLRGRDLSQADFVRPNEGDPSLTASVIDKLPLEKKYKKNDLALQQWRGTREPTIELAKQFLREKGYWVEMKPGR